MSYFIYLLIPLIIILPGCNNYDFLSKEELKGTTLTGEKYTHAAVFKIEAKSICPANLNLVIKNYPYKFQVNEKLDTRIELDWYGNSYPVRIEYDSNCIIEAPKVGYKFLGKKALPF